MRSYVRSPAGILGAATLVAVAAVGAIAVKSVDEAQQSACIARQLAQPWVGFKETFSAPAGDPEARARALKAITRGIERVEHLDRYC